MTARIESCIGGCGTEGPVVPRHPAVSGYLCDECRALDQTVREMATATVILAEARYRDRFHYSRLRFEDVSENLQNEYLSAAARDIEHLLNAGYRIVPADPQTWETVEPSPRIVACPLCGGHVELEDAAGVDEFAGVVSSIDREGRAL